MLIITFKHIIRCLQTVTSCSTQRLGPPQTHEMETSLHLNIEVPDLGVITVKLRHTVASLDF